MDRIEKSRRSFLVDLLTSAAGVWVAVTGGASLLSLLSGCSDDDDKTKKDGPAVKYGGLDASPDKPPVVKYGGLDASPDKPPVVKYGGFDGGTDGPVVKYGGFDAGKDGPPVVKYGGFDGGLDMAKKYGGLDCSA